MMVAAMEIDLTQWSDDDLRDDVKRCMNALALLRDGSPARSRLRQIITDTVTELQRRAPGRTGKDRATICRCGEVFTTRDEATLHFVEVFVPRNNVGNDARIHEELSAPDENPVAWENPVPRQTLTQDVTGPTAHDSGDTTPDGIRM